jgi:hypothetical protein
VSPFDTTVLKLKILHPTARRVKPLWDDASRPSSVDTTEQEISYPMWGDNAHDPMIPV